MYYLDFLIGQGPEKFKPFFTKDHLILASVYNSDDVLVKQWLSHLSPKNPCASSSLK